MRFSDITGFSDIKEAFVSMVDRDKVPHAIMLYENDGGGAMPLALALIQYMSCTDRRDGDSCGECRSCRQNEKLIWPDVHFSFPVTSGNIVKKEVKDITCLDYAEPWRGLLLDNPYFLENQESVALGFEKKQGAITVAEGGSILRDLSLSTVTGGWRTVVIWLPEKMNTQTANMLLKAIEEPSPHTLFLLITHAPEQVLKTISSRCVGIRIPPLAMEDVAAAVEKIAGVSSDEASSVASLSGGSVGVALSLLAGREELDEDRKLFEALMEAVTGRDVYAALDVADAAAGLDSREKQKQFCSYAVESLRKMFLLQQGLPDIAGIAPGEEAFLRKCSAAMRKKSYCRVAMGLFDHASAMIERNVNQKVVFTNLVDRLILNF